MASSPEKEIVLSLISHTNVGKTALARTLLRRDIGEVADSAHVTVVPEAHTLIEHDGLLARLWDTPGFGANLAKLAKRLRSSENPVGWILHQVWDRHTDKSLWCSQEAVRNVQNESDVVLYLVDASQSPAATEYIDLEIEVIEWIGKPVLVFLNQTGQPEPERDQLIETEWRTHLSKHSVVKHVDTLDAFTRCWTEEHHILEKAGEVLEGEKSRTAEKLANAWADRNLNVFRQAAVAMAEWGAFALTDAEPLPQKGISERIRQFISPVGRSDDLDRIQRAMYERLAEKTSSTINELITLHGLDGKTATEMSRAGRDEIAVKRDLEEPLAATLGGAISGLVGGLSADLISGGMTFGGGAIVGMLLGGATTYALARGYNLARTGKNMVRWTEAHFFAQRKFLIMLYLAIAHYGRGRGTWQDPVHNPAHWEELLDKQIASESEAWKKLWNQGGFDSDREKLRKRLERRFAETVFGVLANLYPESTTLFRRL
jgi:hypothetical protein